MMLVGSVAPDFTLKACAPDNSFVDVTLSSFRGKHVVLFFYDADFHAVSATELPGFEKLTGEFAKRKCAVLGISTDSESSHKVWKSMPENLGGIGNVSYPLLSDPLREVASKYNCLMPSGQCVRGVFLIDCDQIVQVEQRNNLPLGRNLDEIVRLLDAIQFHEQSVLCGAPQVIPACWRPGCAAIYPTVEGIAEFAADGGLDRYVMAPESHDQQQRVMYISPIIHNEDKVHTPTNVRVNHIRAANKKSELPMAKRPDFASSFMQVGHSPSGSACFSPSRFGFSPAYGQSSPSFSSPCKSRTVDRQSSRDLTRRVSDMWTV